MIADFALNLLCKTWIGNSCLSSRNRLGTLCSIKTFSKDLVFWILYIVLLPYIKKDVIELE